MGGKFDGALRDLGLDPLLAPVRLGEQGQGVGAQRPDRPGGFVAADVQRLGDIGAGEPRQDELARCSVARLVSELEPRDGHDPVRQKWVGLVERARRSIGKMTGQVPRSVELSIVELIEA